MIHLSSRDIATFNQAALDLQATDSAAEFSAQILSSMSQMLDGELLATDWLDMHRPFSLYCDYHPGKGITEEQNALIHTLMPDTPIRDKLGECVQNAHSVSDFVPRAKWSQGSFYWAMRDFEAEDYLFLNVPLTPVLSVGLVDIRRRFGRHSPEERVKLKLLGPHIQQVYHRLAAQGQVSASSTIVRRLEQVFVTPSGHVTKWTDEARVLLEHYGILVAGDNLSPVVNEWFLAQRQSLENPTEVTLGTTPLCLKRGGMDLSIYLTRRAGLRSYQLILQEKESSLDTSGLLPEYGITKRESEVLYWLAQGKPNAKIATILGMSTGTVGRHLENAFPKLGVENRYAAGLMVNQALADRVLASVPR